MIGRLRGQMVYRGEDHVLLDVGGVGYLVYCSERTLAALPGPDTVVELYTDLLVREDLLQLFGFPSMAEKEWHRLLTSVQGVGAKASLAILGTLGPDGVGRAIALADWSAIKAARGVGPKLAQRVVRELKDKAPGLMASGGGAAPAAAAVLADSAPVSEAAAAEARSALANLGYGPGDAATAVASAGRDAPDANTETLIRAALKHLAPKG